MAVAKQSFYKRRRISSFVLDESLLWQFRRCLREHNDFEIWCRFLTMTFGILLLFKQELYFQCKKAISFLECLIQNTFKLQVFFLHMGSFVFKGWLPFSRVFFAKVSSDRNSSESEKSSPMQLFADFRVRNRYQTNSVHF